MNTEKTNWRIESYDVATSRYTVKFDTTGSNHREGGCYSQNQLASLRANDYYKELA